MVKMKEVVGNLLQSIHFASKADVILGDNPKTHNTIVITTII